MLHMLNTQNVCHVEPDVGLPFFWGVFTYFWVLNFSWHHSCDLDARVSLFADPLWYLYDWLSVITIDIRVLLFQSSEVLMLLLSDSSFWGARTWKRRERWDRALVRHQCDKAVVDHLCSWYMLEVQESKTKQHHWHLFEDEEVPSCAGIFDVVRVACGTRWFFIIILSTAKDCLSLVTGSSTRVCGDRRFPK